MADRPELDDDYPTTGHEWDGIREYDKPLPKWWLYVFYATIVWGVIWVILFPAWPLISTSTSGLIRYTPRAALDAELKAHEATYAPLNEQLVALAEEDLATIADDPNLSIYAARGGAAVFKTYCAQCHGAGAQGNVPGFPNLLDDDWLWGGTIYDVHQTIAHGIRSEEDDDTRYSEMPAFGDMLENEQIDQVVNFVLSLSNLDHDASFAEAGAVVFEENCAACHGETGMGDPALGAPNLTDAIWLYGSNPADIEYTVRNARYGMMPAWKGRLTDAQIAQVAYYVHQLGGGQ